MRIAYDMTQMFIIINKLNFIPLIVKFNLETSCLCKKELDVHLGYKYKHLDFNALNKISCSAAKFITDGQHFTHCAGRWSQKHNVVGIGQRSYKSLTHVTPNASMGELVQQPVHVYTE